MEPTHFTEYIVCYNATKDTLMVFNVVLGYTISYHDIDGKYLLTNKSDILNHNLVKLGDL